MQWLWPIPVSLVAAYLINIPPQPRMVIHGQLMRHRRQVTLQYYCWQKVGIWHSKSVVSFIWVMALFTGGGLLSWSCHNVPLPGHSDPWWSQLPSLSSDVITSSLPWSVERNTWPCVSQVKIIPDDGNTAVISNDGNNVNNADDWDAHQPG